MLKSGVVYNIYEVDEKNYYRFDIVTEGAIYQLEPQNIIFSEFKKRKTYRYGDSFLKNKIDTIVQSLTHLRAEMSNETKWENGKFVLIQRRVVSDESYSEVIQENGKMKSRRYVFEGETYFIQMQYENYTSLLDPLNMDDYIEQKIMLEGHSSNISSPYNSLDLLRSRFNIEHLFKKKYGYIKDVNSAEEYLVETLKAFQRGELIGVDTETTGLEVDLYGKDVLVGVIISIDENEAKYFPFRHTKEANLPMEFLDKLLKTIKMVESNAVAHNKKFERKVFWKCGWDIRIKHDSFLASVLVNPKLGRNLHSLKHLEEERSGEKYLEFDDIFIDKKNINFADLPEDIITYYACPDSDNTKKILKWKLKQLPEYERNIYDIECELADLKADQEYWGFRIDSEDFMIGYENAKSTVDMLEKLIHSVAREEFKVTSGDALGNILYNKMKCPIYVRTKTGKPSTGNKAIKKLSTINLATPSNVIKTDIKDSLGNILIKASELNSKKYPITLLILKHKEAIKLLTGFYNRIQNNAVSNEHSTLRYFSWINQNGAESGRQSSPLHQLPKPIKKDILPDSEDHIILDSDYAQIELRLIFSLAGEKELIELCKDAGVDIHRAIGSIISGKEVWEIDATMRQEGKSRNFGVVYGISGSGLAVQQYGAGASADQVRKAEDSIAEFYRAFRRIAKYIRDNEEYVLKNGKMITYFGRVRYFTEIFDKDISSSMRKSYIRQANNLPVQGTAADIMKIAEVNLNRYIRNKGWDKLVDTPQGKYPLARVMLSAHDEALVSWHKSLPIEEALLMNRECMEIQIDGFAPLFAETACITNWKEGKDDSFACPRELRDRLISEYQKTGITCAPNDIKSEMYQLIDKFRDEELYEYMEDLMRKYNGDAKLVAEHVRHPSLTHDLINRFKQTEDHKKEFGKLSHLEHIRYSVDRYIENRGKLKDKEVKPLEVVDEVYEMPELEDILVEIDKDGNAVYHDEYGVADEEYDLTDNEDLEAYKASGKIIKVWELFDSICIDVDGLKMQDTDELLAKIYEQRDSDGFFKVLLSYQGKLLDTQIRVEKIDLKEIEKFIELKESSYVR